MPRENLGQLSWQCKGQQRNQGTSETEFAGVGGGGGGGYLATVLAVQGTAGKPRYVRNGICRGRGRGGGVLVNCPGSARDSRETKVRQKRNSQGVGEGGGYLATVLAVQRTAGKPRYVRKGIPRGWGREGGTWQLSWQCKGQQRNQGTVHQKRNL